jgi:hypothetical protein
MESLKSGSPSTYNPITKEQFWIEHVALQKESSLSIAAYCRKHELNCDQFYHWRRKLTKTSNLIPVKLHLNKKADHLETLCTLTFKTGTEIKIHNQVILPFLITLLG